MRLCRLFLCALFVVPATARAAPILLNGSFDVGPPVPTNDIDVLPGSMSSVGWLVTGTSVDYLGAAWDVPDGSRAIHLDGRDAILRGIQQTFATSVGERYAVSFDLSGNPQGGP